MKATAVLSFAVPFVIVVIVWFFANIVAPGLKITFGNLDRPLGFIFGLMRGFVLIAFSWPG